MAKMESVFKLKVDLEMVKLVTRRIINDISIVTKTIAHKDVVVEIHKKHLQINEQE